MDLLTWLIVGLVAGVLASMVMGGTGYGLIGDIVIGIAGAFVGGWVLRKLGTSVPIGGLPGVINAATHRLAFQCLPISFTAVNSTPFTLPWR